ncbi:MAG: hypothetical protein IPM74_12280 [Crocinitomicaceae bacterium]|nr:hypothetical protein [Crocinitomicaceae bacterium]MBK8926652.1 hypothetical protein [Crocinitomicaceae bacterium]
MRTHLLTLLSIIGIAFLIIFSSLWAWEDGKFQWDVLITVAIGILALVVSIYSIKIAKYDIDYRSCLTILEAIQKDLESIQVDKFLEHHPELLSRLTTEQIDESNGVEFYDLYHVFYTYIINNNEYKVHLLEKDNVAKYNFYGIIQSMNHYLLSKQSYSFDEIIVIINETEKSGMTGLQKKFIFRKIRRIVFRYYNLLEAKRNEAHSALVDHSHTVTNYLYDIPFYEEQKIKEKSTWSKTSLFEKIKYDKLYKLMIENHIDARGFNVASEF